MPHFLISGTGDLVEPVSTTLQSAGHIVVVAADQAEVAAACAEAGPRFFDGYVQLPARFGLLGDTAVERIHHFVAHGIMARYPAMAAALPSLAPGARIAFVPAVLPAEVATDDDVQARAALLRVLARAARADGPDGLRVSFLGSGSTAEEIALDVQGRGPKRSDRAPEEPDRSYADWRTELLGMMSATG
jgi:hypothetical protein